MERNIKDIQNRQRLLKQRISNLSLPSITRCGSRLGQTAEGEYFVHSRKDRNAHSDFNFSETEKHLHIPTIEIEPSDKLVTLESGMKRNSKR